MLAHQTLTTNAHCGLRYSSTAVQQYSSTAVQQYSTIYIRLRRTEGFLGLLRWWFNLNVSLPLELLLCYFSLGETKQITLYNSFNTMQCNALSCTTMHCITSTTCLKQFLTFQSSPVQLYVI